MLDHMRTNTPPPIMEDDSDDDIPIGDDDIEIIDDSEIDQTINFNDENGIDYIEEGNDDDDDGLDLGEDELGESTWQDMAKWKFDKHTSSVFCCSVDSSNTNVATGGEDDKAYLWNIETQEVLLECTGHEDSVTNVVFNHDGTLLATGDMKGIIKVWKISSKSKIWEFETSDLRWLEWHKNANILFAGTIEGEAWMWLIPGIITKTFPSFGNAITTGKLLPDGKKMVLGYEDGSVRIWDLKAVSVIYAVTGVSAHTEGVTSLECSPDNSIILSGSEDATVKLISVLTGKVVTTFDVDTSSVETIAFSPRSSLVALGTLNGTVVIWDSSSQTMRHTIKDLGVVVKIVWHPSEEQFFVACLNGTIEVIDARSSQSLERYHGHRGDVLDLVITSDGNRMITACDDYECRVFDRVKEVEVMHT